MSAKPLIVAAIGSRGTGKSAFVRQYLARLKPSRLAVWDLMREHGAPSGSLGDCIRAMGGRTWRVVFQPSMNDKQREREFALWCSAIYEAKRVHALVEELSMVTTPWKAPEAWRKLNLLGRHRDVAITGTAQRPAQVDKQFWGNCDVIHCGRLVDEDDAKVLGKVLGVPYAEIMRMPDLDFYERKAGDGAAVRGRLKFSAPSKPVPRQPSGPNPQGANLRPPAPVVEAPATLQPTWLDRL